MTQIHRLLVVAALLACAAPALADVIPEPPAQPPPLKKHVPKDEPAPATPPAPAGDPDDGVDALDDPEAQAAALAEAVRQATANDPPRKPAPPPLDEEALDANGRLKELPPPSIGVGELVGPLLKTMFMLCVVLLLVYLTLHKGLGKLVERQNLGKRVKVVERVTLDAKRGLFLVEIDGKQMLIAAGEGGVTLLKDLDAPPLSASASNGGPSLGARFAEALRTKVAGEPPVTTGLSREAATVPTDKSGGAT